MLIKSLFISLLLVLVACDRDNPNTQTASLTINNTTDLRITPLLPLSIWSIYVTPTNSLTPALDRSIDLLASVALKAGVSRTFSINTCGQQLDVLVILSDGSEQVFTSVGSVDCDTTYSEDVI
jgi:hypothetical protein